jgi:phage gp46-like protein
VLALAYDIAAQQGDLVREDGGNLETDEGLETAVVVSLFSDARAREGDPADPNGDPRGWWGDAYLEAPDHQLGSRLWLLKRHKTTVDGQIAAINYTKEALQWLLDDRVASTVDVTLTRLAQDVFLLTVGIQRPKKTAPRWEGRWEVQLGL